ncbi:MAG: hypothetical protein KAT05_07730 [Spirochaetes bacterium]|nr:hypothetical protein [Spirochaetota bacterium]
MTDRTTNGILILEKVDFNRVLTRTVHKSNKSSGKITLPLDLVGKEVIIVIPNKKK